MCSSEKNADKWSSDTVRRLKEAGSSLEMSSCTLCVQLYVLDSVLLLLLVRYDYMSELLCSQTTIERFIEPL